MKVTKIGASAKNAEIAKGWRKRSIFWDLSYWKKNLIRHNLDVMHIKKNVFDNIFNFIISVPKKIKDNVKLRQDVRKICYRPSLHMDEVSKKYPLACYTIDNPKK
ncbi:hypothetical protein Syun_006894 [Stephania yunnanensis]|uniref:Uncharacterized protein n=1 Tax=Stephania yunnanensis TaxID=152371 RepID=A0AAP0PY32_9MAGN